MWEYLGGKRGSRHPDKRSGGHNNNTGRAPHRIIPGGFFFAGTLPGEGRVGDGAQKGALLRKKRTGGKKKGKPARRR